MITDNEAEPGIITKTSSNNKNFKLFFSIAIGLILWVFIYIWLQRFANFIAFDVLRLAPSSHLGSSVSFFVFDSPKVMMLLVLVVFGIGIVRSFFTAERTRGLLAGKKEFVGNIMAASLGIVTPFCSCSACPLFIGFVEAGIPLGVTLSFLIASPMINEVAAILLLGMFGLRVALIYVVTGLIIAIIAGWIIGWLKLERYIQDWVLERRRTGTQATTQG